MKRLSSVWLLVIGLWLFQGFASADDQERSRQKVQLGQQEGIYGGHLMTQQERVQYHKRLQAADTAEEREKIRNEHRERMEERARNRGVTLPGEPPAVGRDMGPKGGGMGPEGGSRGARGGRHQGR